MYEEHAQEGLTYSIANVGATPARVLAHCCQRRELDRRETYMKSGEFHLFVFSLRDLPKTTVIFSVELDVPFVPARNSIPGQISQVS